MRKSSGKKKEKPVDRGDVRLICRLEMTPDEEYRSSE
jgi:hypothetical protein